MTPEYRRAYAKGYIAGSRGRWPDHKPPLPPNEMAAELIATLKAMRNCLDGELAKLDKEDPWESLFGPLIDRADEALAKVNTWLRAEEIQCGGSR